MISRRPDFDPAAQVNSGSKLTVATITVSVPLSPLLDDVRKAYADDKDFLRLMDHLVNQSRKSLENLSALYRSSLDSIRIATGTIQPLPTTHLVYLLPVRMIYDCALCLNAKMQKKVGIVAFLKVTSWFLVNFTSPAIISSYESTFVLARSAIG